ncbi:hypothetical protein EUGRSUZ_G00004 [Eucalyptus grandis]|uniref:Uncharacterized protein n=5 Tax=Eucalyptus grandis TaxID=71139 RepID=A0ACC3JZI8_EUCGR|nr:hypothetical protein EUGRSUZ_G00004 [Eucalyptus grandis]
MQKPLFTISLSHSIGIFMASEDARLQKVLSFPSITEAFLEVPPQPIYFPTSKCHMDMLPRQEQAKLAACPGSSIVTGSSGKSGKHTVASARAVQGLRWISKSPQLEFTKIQCKWCSNFL